MKQRTIEGHCVKITEAIKAIKEITAEGDPNGCIPSIKKKINKRRAEIRRMVKAEEAREKAEEAREALLAKILSSENVGVVLW